MRHGCSSGIFMGFLPKRLWCRYLPSRIHPLHISIITASSFSFGCKYKRLIFWLYLCVAPVNVSFNAFLRGSSFLPDICAVEAIQLRKLIGICLLHRYHMWIIVNIPRECHFLTLFGWRDSCKNEVHFPWLLAAIKKLNSISRISTYPKRFTNGIGDINIDSDNRVFTVITIMPFKRADSPLSSRWRFFAFCKYGLIPLTLKLFCCYLIRARSCTLSSRWASIIFFIWNLINKTPLCK